jgi:hypothetical protein
MSWAGLTNNQTISGNNLLNAIQTNVFVAQFGFIPSLEQMTKINVNVYVHLDTSFAPFAAKSSNQLVVKSNLKASLNAIGLSEERNEAFDACLVPFVVNQAVTFGGTLGVGTQINQTVPVSGNNGFFLIVSPIGHPNYLNVIGINDDGEVIYLENICPF